MTNPLLQPSTLPFQLPDYATITDADVREALDAGMEEQVTELDEIASSTEPATVANTLEAWERSGATLSRALNAFWVAKSADTNPERDAIMAEFMPKLAHHSDAILLNTALFDRLRALATRHAQGEVDFDDQEAHLLHERLREFKRGGIQLPEEDKSRLREINAELARLSTEFEQRIVAGRNAGSVLVTDPAELDGLSEDDRSAARGLATDAGQEGWLITLVNTTGQPVLPSLRNRTLRERVYKASISRGLGGEHDTRQLVLDTLHLRNERARLLGFEHHAAYVADDGCAKTTENVTAMLTRVAPGVLEITRREAADLEARFLADNPGGTFEAWDWDYYAAQAAAEKAIDAEVLKPYLEFERVLVHGVFAAATKLYGITFHERPELVGYTADARVFEVREESGDTLGAVVIDPFTRPTKQGGAWMTSIVEQSHLLDDAPVVTNTCNFPKPAPGAPSLLTWDNVITLFHEFGHDLHGLLSDVRFPSRSGTATPQDFVEYPSQVNEIWAWDPELLADYAVHHATGEPMPASLREALVANRRQGIGRNTFETTSAMMLDQTWHTTAADELPTSVDEVEAFEVSALQAWGVWFPLVMPRYRTTYFAHIFASGYAASYYSYLWSEVMDADTVAWFKDNGGLDREVGEKFRRGLLAVGGSVPVMEAYEEFRGAAPDVKHLLARIGLE
ncbi:M3 family metallopeptidase [Tessaracoccus antarcticus]|uniref:M3 family peptidase n=1 Tax=Tessaracoccus antarcticus TaxID=2479848 RepID=A0A3M0GEC8_9ACTN|nr:M3 family metallopeptidase [Tessaracoccus antarcticus]RMB59963.1 M3 family peptidase [Tessaracoccus antarcticus]